MQHVNDGADVGVIVGRFQVPYLHDGHKTLIDYVVGRHKKVIIVLGISRTFNTANEPLDFEARKQMILENYKNVIVLGVQDNASDLLWSKSLDSAVRQVVSPTQSVLMYGSRDSFIKAYQGFYGTKELIQENYQSGTDIRDEIRQEVVATEDFRKGVIWASANRFPVVFTCVDIAIIKADRTKILLGQKKEDTLYRLPGGFADVNSPSYEHDAYREAFEETKVGFMGELEYLQSYTIDDWRYRKEPDTIKTLLFRGYTVDIGRAGDDLDEVQWFNIDVLKENVEKWVEPMHVPLVKRALEGL